MVFDVLNKINRCSTHEYFESSASYYYNVRTKTEIRFRRKTIAKEIERNSSVKVIIFVHKYSKFLKHYLLFTGYYSYNFVICALLLYCSCYIMFATALYSNTLTYCYCCSKLRGSMWFSCAKRNSFWILCNHERNVNCTAWCLNIYGLHIKSMAKCWYEYAIKPYSVPKPFPFVN